MSVVERWRPTTGRVYRIGDRLLRLLYVRRGEPTFEIEVHPLPIEWPERARRETGCETDEQKCDASKMTTRDPKNFDLEPLDPSTA
jgi:hypothetical protein